MIAKYDRLSIKKIGGGTRVVTVTLNPAVDRTLWVPGFEAGKTFSVERSETVAGGKGVNVSRALRRLGIDSTATGIIGRDGSGPYLGALDAEGLSHDFVFVDGTLRTNVTVLACGGASGAGEAHPAGRSDETHLREKGPAVAEAALAELEQKLKALIKKPCLVVFSGSLPLGLPDDSYARLVELAKSRGARSALDSSGAPLRLGLKTRPFLIKPNAREVEESLGFLPNGEAGLREAIRRYTAEGIEAVMISLGKEGLAYSRPQSAGGEGDSRVSAVRARLSVERPLNAVGSGDAALAGAIAGILSGFCAKDTARLACAAGAANTLVSGACVFRSEDVERLFGMTEVKAL
jgi:tagatose 6-phosphate kinase